MQPDDFDATNDAVFLVDTVRKRGHVLDESHLHWFGFVDVVEFVIFFAHSINWFDTSIRVLCNGFERIFGLNNSHG